MERNQYLEKLIRRKHNGLVKVITGIRCSGKSYLLFEKEQQEERSLVNINDSFKKIIIVKDGITHYNEEGIYILNLFDFLLDNDSINR